jgi:2-keto-3-deoxy-L-rhamnonate aldolase RhmA
MISNPIGLKKRMREGQQILGASVPATANTDRIREVVESGPYDFISVDSQHSPLSEARLAAFCGLCEELDVFVQFRIKHTRNAYLIGNYLDLGPCGVEVPQTELDETVSEALHYFYYPPEGGRSYGGRARRGVSEHPDPVDYGAWWNTFGILWLQIESVEAVTRAHIFARPGVDCLSFGPTDLMFNLMGHPNHNLKTVDDCVAYVARSLEGSGVAVCHRIGPPENRQKYVDMGVTVLLENASV